MPLPTRPTYARRLAHRWLTALCVITDPGTPVRAASGSGGSEAGTPTEYADVACRIAPKDTTATVAQFAEQVLADADWVLYVARGTPIAAGWRVTVDGVTYAVIAEAQGTGAVYRQALLKRQVAV
ncbi:MAG: hypothetical protein AB7R89_06160 [Dehalococcoidia bacterium]